MPRKSRKDSGCVGGDGASQITAVELKILNVIFKNCDATSKPRLTDWDGIAKPLDMKDGKSAKERFRQICKKMGWFENKEGADQQATPSRKKRALEDADDNRMASSKKIKVEGEDSGHA
ncbi:hypothetical protein GGS23DRAFT_548752 [Durotheca rogersii]|uniref:uncharacterized protein n=1 Tax=Durotheca rogersii TaxID=419775 RepID=UPI00221F41D9|nr:uncharacterized protein GGS23DRAFT_548752 [Durotheca rogersii]KAI5867529.1 hypothetical protein GGS23DRAFT_548752 [Durotheca rogersii]